MKIEICKNSLWLPIYTQPLHEFRLQEYFQERGIPCYLPLVPKLKVQHVNSEKKNYKYEKTVMKPMFSSYVFAQLTPDQKNAAWRSNSIIRFYDVAYQQDSFIEELHGVQLIEELAKNSKVEYRSDFKVGDYFVIESPPFEGTYGFLEQRKKNFAWIIKIECLGTYVSAEIDPSLYKMRKIEHP